MSRFTIAIDGPAAAGKSTVGERLARRLNAVYFDTGLLYRAVTLAAQERGIAPDDEVGLARLARSLDIRVQRPTVADGRQSDVLVNGVDVTARLRSPEVDRDVSRVSAHQAVRDALLPVQRRIAQGDRVVMVGRDIGTVVLPNAELKVYLDASPEERARRRCAEQANGCDPADQARMLEEIRRRDCIDSQRSAAPLRAADDAIIVNTDRLTIDAVVDRIISEAVQRQLVEDAAGATA